MYRCSRRPSVPPDHRRREPEGARRQQGRDQVLPGGVRAQAAGAAGQRGPRTADEGGVDQVGQVDGVPLQEGAGAQVRFYSIVLMSILVRF